MLAKLKKTVQHRKRKKLRFPNYSTFFASLFSIAEQSHLMSHLIQPRRSAEKFLGAEDDGQAAMK